MELLVTLVTKHEYQKACSLMVPEQKLLPIQDHSLLHCVICVSGEAHTQDSCPSNQLRQLVRTALMLSDCTAWSLASGCEPKLLLEVLILLFLMLVHTLTHTPKTCQLGLLHLGLHPAACLNPGNSIQDADEPVFLIGEYRYTQALGLPRRRPSLQGPCS